MAVMKIEPTNQNLFCGHNDMSSLSVSVIISITVIIMNYARLDDIFSGYQPRQVSVLNRRFGDHLGHIRCLY